MKLNLTGRERELLESIATIGRQDISMSMLADRMHITYKSLMRMRSQIVMRNGYYSFEALLCDYILDDFQDTLA